MSASAPEDATPQRPVIAESESLRSTIAEKIFRALKNEIITGALRPGQVLNEGSLAKHFGVSKSPVREALTLLRCSDLVRVIPRRGHIVSPLSFEEVRELLQLRTILESAAAELAAQHGTEQQLALLRDLVAQTASAFDKGTEGVPEIIALNKQFHLTLAAMSGNLLLADYIGQILDRAQRLIYIDFRFSNWELPPRKHPAIVDALANRDPAAAKAAMIAHIESDTRRLLRWV